MIADDIRAQGQQEWRWVASLSAITLIAVALALLVGFRVGVPTGPILLAYTGAIWMFVPLIFAGFLIPWTIRAALLRIPSPFEALKPVLAKWFANPGLAAGTLAPIALMPLLMGAFGSLKQTMPLARPFTWDASLAAADRAIFFNQDPWQLTHALLGSPFLTAALDKIYTLWVPLLFVMVLVIAFAAPRQLRARFFLSFGISWLVIGVALAFLFASAGPCYAAFVGADGANHFAPLMDRLKAINDNGYPLGAYDWQTRLWGAHLTGKYGFGLGVSAMPSMHNSITFLYLLAAWNCRPVWRWSAMVLTAVIFVASVHLGWHYAVDALLAWAVMGAIWWAVGWYLRRFVYRAADPAAAVYPSDLAHQNA